MVKSSNLVCVLALATVVFSSIVVAQSPKAPTEFPDWPGAGDPIKLIQEHRARVKKEEDFLYERSAKETGLSAEELRAEKDTRIETVRQMRLESDVPIERRAEFENSPLGVDLQYIVTIYDPSQDWEGYFKIVSANRSRDQLPLGAEGGMNLDPNVTQYFLNTPEQKSAFQERTKKQKARLTKIFESVLPENQLFTISDFIGGSEYELKLALTSPDENFANVLLDAKMVEHTMVMPVSSDIRLSGYTSIYDQPPMTADIEDWDKESGYQYALKKFESGYTRGTLEAVLDLNRRDLSKTGASTLARLRAFISDFDKSELLMGINPLGRDAPDDLKITYTRKFTREQLEKLYSSPLVINIVPKF